MSVCAQHRTVVTAAILQEDIIHGVGSFSQLGFTYRVRLIFTSLRRAETEVICRLSTSLTTSTLWMPRPSPSPATATVNSPRQTGGRLILDVMFEGLE